MKIDINGIFLLKKIPKKLLDAIDMILFKL